MCLTALSCRRLALCVFFCYAFPEACLCTCFSLLCLFEGLLCIRFQSRIFYTRLVGYACSIRFSAVPCRGLTVHIQPSCLYHASGSRDVGSFQFSSFQWLTEEQLVSRIVAGLDPAEDAEVSDEWARMRLSIMLGDCFFQEEVGGSFCRVMERSDLGLCLCLIAGRLFFPRRGWKSLCSVNKCEGERKAEQNGGQEELTPSRE